MTHDCTRLEYARVCVEIDNSDTPIHNFEIHCPNSEDPILVDVEYEWKPKWCKDCHQFGHNCLPPQKASKPSPSPATQPPADLAKSSELEISHGSGSKTTQAPSLPSDKDVSQVSRKPKDVSSSFRQAPPLPPPPPLQDDSQIPRKSKEVSSSASPAPQLPPLSSLRDDSQVSQKPIVTTGCSSSVAPASGTSLPSSSANESSAQWTEVKGKEKRRKAPKPPN